MIPRALDEALKELALDAQDERLLQVGFVLSEARRLLALGADGYVTAIASLQARADACDVAKHPDTIPVELGEAARDARDIYLRAIAVLREHAEKEAA